METGKTSSKGNIELYGVFFSRWESLVQDLEELYWRKSHDAYLVQFFNHSSEEIDKNGLPMLLQQKMVCCKCNRTRKCSNCACKKSGRSCSICLPMKFNKCSNPETSEDCISSSSFSFSHRIPSVTDIHDKTITDPVGHHERFVCSGFSICDHTCCSCQ